MRLKSGIIFFVKIKNFSFSRNVIQYSRSFDASIEKKKKETIEKQSKLKVFHAFELL